ncbi:MAG TPA: bacteriohopanetetrol glucosamine biosynthesis glycosyltransferase HpnI [Phenylobacterium sp.]|uniref:bacteriohopanetetrol glucosamine biosynthesis glycosyltransferase HpnI n=1 Tax=Phenylobacterium sp. TaxID=1871053 RepID=UPI002BA49781|nr:bacteriohopanetetrol glucosamine biosynthesis glycosyltransferase HpnI [Phenylobacterium sp.]HXA40586.1 bacteriohopanetetrol glucosamine biosynthesis glycosyltransferase HpnI [Phenylobacterium sp.]
MSFLLILIGWCFAGLALAGSAYQLLAARLLRRLLAPPPPREPQSWPGVTVLKPLHGAESGLEAALASLLAQDYAGPLQVVFGVQSPTDPAQAVVGTLRRAHPAADVALTVDATDHGANRKVSNLINMIARAKHEVLIVADSDIVVAPGYLRGVVAALGAPQAGVVTCPYRGLPAEGFWSRLAAMGISYQFLPSVAVGVGLGMAHPCMGSTVALRRETLERIGGFAAFADQLADDYAIGAAVRAAGLRSIVAPVLVGHLSAEDSLEALVQHELRWARTVRGVDPAGFAGSVVTYPTPLALLAIIFTGAAPIGLAALGIALICRFLLQRGVDRLAGARTGPWWLTPLRDGLSFAVFLGAFFVRAVDWRGARFRVDAQGTLGRI